MIQFFKGLKSSYQYPSNPRLQDAIYFATDTGELLVNGVNYGNDAVKVVDVTSSDSNLVITMANGTTKSIPIGLDQATQDAIQTLKGLIDEDGNLKISLQYQSKMADSLTTLETIGGIAAGTTAESLKQKTLSEVFDDLLFPTIQPTAQDPSATLTLTTTNIREVGSKAPNANEFIANWNPGKILIAGQTQANRAGEKQSGVIYANTEATGMPDKVTLGSTNYYYKVTYAKGPNPLDSKGHAATSLVALPAGSILSAAVYVYGVYPFYATTTDANIANGTVTKLPLTNSTSFTCTLAAESATNKHTFKLPHTVSKIELKDPFGNWVTQTISEFPKTTENIDVNGTTVSYNVYTRNQGQNGATEFRITYTK